MPRLRQAVRAVSDDGFPVELTDESHPVWATVEATEEFLRAHRLDIGKPIEYGPVSRCKASGRAWARAASIVKGHFTGNQDLDLVRMRELGIRAGWAGSAEGHERLTFHGVLIVESAMRRPVTDGNRHEQSNRI